MVNSEHIVQYRESRGMIKDTVHLRLRMARLACGLTTAAVGRQLGVTGAAVGNWELGTREPNIETLKRLAAIYGVTVGWLMGEAPFFQEGGYPSNIDC